MELPRIGKRAIRCDQDETWSIQTEATLSFPTFLLRRHLLIFWNFKIIVRQERSPGRAQPCETRKHTQQSNNAMRFALSSLKYIPHFSIPLPLPLSSLSFLSSLPLAQVLQQMPWLGDDRPKRMAWSLFIVLRC